MNAAPRRGACPGLSTPMLTGDGLLLRLRLQRPIPLPSFAALCAEVARHGNGTIEISARGSLQLRGLTPDSAPLLASAIAALDISGDDGIPVITDPLPADPAALIESASLAAVLRRALAHAQLNLAPKISIVIDGGGRLHLDALAADVRLRAVGPAGAPRLHVALGGDARSAVPLGSIAPECAVGLVVRLLRVIAERGCEARARDILAVAGTAPFRAAADPHPDPPPFRGGEQTEFAAGIDPIATEWPPPARAPADPFGPHRLLDGSFALGVAFAFGHAHADAVGQLCKVAADHDLLAVRPAPGRALLLLGAREKAAAALPAEAERLGFVVRADDSRRSIAACPGKPACASGIIAARSVASEIAPHLPPARGEIAIHISGCAKGCAHHRPADLTVVGTERGCGVVRGGSARATPSYHVDVAELVAEVTRIAGVASEAAHG